MLVLMRRFGSRSLLLLVPPLLLGLLQLLVVASQLPRDAGEGGGEDEVAFAVISIEPEPGPRNHRGRPDPVRDPEEPGEYEEENELRMRQVAPRALEIQPWASDPPTFSSELSRLTGYLSRPQVNCSKVLGPESSEWLLCADEWLLPHDTCVAYSFSMSGGDADFLKLVSGLGCEVHTFDPSNSDASPGYRGDGLAGNQGEGGEGSEGRAVVRQHKMWLEWRARRKARSMLGSVSRTLADIMTALGHDTVHFLHADLLSAEWRILQNWVETGTLQRVHHLVASSHLQWAGFEVAGSDEEVIRFWFSVLRGLESRGLKLVHSSAGAGHDVLRRASAGHSSYTLSWVNTGH